MKRNKRYLLCCLAALLILFWFCYTVLHYPLLDSDHVIQVIMIDHLQLPGDLYFMGQDRIGSVIPLIGWFFYQMGFSPLVAVSLTQCLILTTISLVLLSLFRNPWYALPAFIVLFFPLSDFDNQVMPGHPYLGHLLVLFLAILLFKKTSKTNPAFLLFSGLGIWASGLFTVNLLVAGLMFFLYKRQDIFSRSTGLWFLKGLLWALPGMGLLLWAKATSTTTDSHYTQSSLVSWEELIQNFQLFGKLLLERATFQYHDIWLGVTFWGALILLVLAIKPLFQQKITSWAWFFVLSGTATFAAILLSEWANHMGLPARYFSIAWLQLCWGLLLAADRQTIRKTILVPTVALLCLSGAISGIASHYSAWRNIPGRIQVRDARAVAEQLDTKGILGSYWTVYLIEAFRPEATHSLVDDQGINRDYRAMKKFPAIDTVTLIANDWIPLHSQVYDHGVYYRKLEPTQRAGELEYARYLKSGNFKNQYSFRELRHSYGDSVQTEDGQEAVLFNPENFNGNIFAAYGPYITLPAGNYEACFDIWSDGDVSGSYLDVYSRGTTLGVIHLPQEGEKCIRFLLEEPQIYTEFRVVYQGKGSIYFRKIELRSLP